MADDRPITASEAAALLGVHRATVVNWAKAGRFPAATLASNGRGAVYRFMAADIVAYRESRDPVAAAAPPAVVTDDGAGGDLISTVQAAALLAVSRATVINWARAGRLPAIQYESTGNNGLFRFRRADILAYRDRSRVVIGPPGARPSGDPDS